MPGGIDNPAIGYATFCAIKLFGYTLAAKLIKKRYESTTRNVWVVGATRTLIGMVAGAGYFFIVFGVFSEMARSGGIYFLAGFLPIRLFEWWLLIWIFYDRRLQRTKVGWQVIGVGTLWSYLLDVPAIAGYVFTAGVWIC